MKKTTRAFLLTTTTIALMCSTLPCAHAADAASPVELQRQISLQQQQLAAQQKLLATQQAAIDKLVAKQAETEKAVKTASTQVEAVKQVQTSQPPETKPVTAKSQATTAQSSKTKTAAGRLQESIQKSTGATISVGGFFDATTLFRTKNQGSDAGSDFNTGIPFNSSPNAHQSEFRETARTSRLNIEATGAIDSDTSITGFIEADFLGTGHNSSPVEVNNYTPRLRQGWAAYDRNDIGFHFLAGQAFSLATQNSSGIKVRNELLPMSPDMGTVPGTVYLLQPQLRVVKDFYNKSVTAGLSLEAPSTNFASTGTDYGVNTAANASLSDGNTSVDIAPDVIAKVAFDPGFGHYELFGVGRTFHNRFNGDNNDVFAPSGGGSAYFKLFNEKLEIAANVMGGQAVGRYAAAQMPDITYSPTGDIKPLTGFAALLGAVVHATPTLDLFSYAGYEETLRESYDGQGAVPGSVGYGNESLTTSTCDGPESVTTCNAQTQSVWQVTGGGWKSIYDGHVGNVKIGLQQSLTRRDAFSGVGGVAPHAYESITMASFRYTPKF